MDVEYEQSLQRAVASGLKAEEDVTINSARARAEEELGLDAGFFKSDAIWKAKSKAIVQAAVDNHQSSPEKPKPKPQRNHKGVVAKAKAGTKRKSNDAHAASNKRSKRAAEPVPDSDVSELSDCEREDSKQQDKKEEEEEEQEEEASEFGDSEEEEKPRATAKKVRGKATSKPKAKPAAKRKPAAKMAKDESESGSEAEGLAKPAKRKSVASKKSEDAVKSDSEDEDAPTSRTKDESDSKGANPPKANGIPTPEDDESDMSVLIDDPPPKKKRASNDTSKAKTTKAPKPAASRKKGVDLSPNEEEIRRLQGWIVKCGVRKLWHNELKGCDTDKAKIRHLKKMLEDLGMTGRYSNEKARGIMEARELAAELEAAQEYAAKWGSKDDKNDDSSDGKGSEDDGTDSKAASAVAVPRRPKGFVDFGDSGDESD